MQTVSHSHSGHRTQATPCFNRNDMFWGKRSPKWPQKVPLLSQLLTPLSAVMACCPRLGHWRDLSSGEGKDGYGSIVGDGQEGDKDRLIRDRDRNRGRNRLNEAGSFPLVDGCVLEWASSCDSSITPVTLLQWAVCMATQHTVFGIAGRTACMLQP